MVMHRTLKEMPGRKVEMCAVAAHGTHPHVSWWWPTADIWRRSWFAVTGRSSSCTPERRGG